MGLHSVISISRQVRMEDKFSQCKEIHQMFLENPDYVDFRSPVNWKELGLLDYPTIIKQPMDLGTIDRKLKKDYYKTPAEYIMDMRLVYRNCMTYNLEATPLYEVGKKFMEEFEALVKERNLFDFAFKLATVKTESRIDQLLREIASSSAEVKDCVFTILHTVCPECLILNDDLNYTISSDIMTADALDYVLEFLVSLKSS